MGDAKKIDDCKLMIDDLKTRLSIINHQSEVVELGVDQIMTVVPLNDKIVVKRLEAEEKTAGGIVLPDTAKEKPRQGKVLSLGDGKRLDNGKRASFQVKEGDRVLFTSYAGNEVTIDGEELLIMTEDDILAVVE
jgi:chaperonin GroES